MHNFHHDPQPGSGPETTGLTIHWAARYDVLTRLLGLGVDRANSRMVVEMARIKPGDRVLDVGCGTGSLTLTARKYAGESGAVYGIDASPEMVEMARRKAKGSGLDAVFEVGLVENIPYPEASFDVVISRLVVHHLPDELKSKAFREIFRVLKPGGLLFIADFKPPTNPVLAHVISGLGAQRMLQHTVAGIPAMLTETGLVDIASGPTRSSLLAFVSGRKPGA